MDPIPYSTGSVIENATTGDGQAIDSNSVPNPEIWENCILVYNDAQSDKKVSASDSIWIYKDYDNDGIEEITSGYRIKIVDGNGKEVLTKEL